MFFAWLFTSPRVLLAEVVFARSVVTFECELEYMYVFQFSAMFFPHASFTQHFPLSFCFFHHRFLKKFLYHIIFVSLLLALFLVCYILIVPAILLLPFQTQTRNTSTRTHTHTHTGRIIKMEHMLNAVI